MLQTTKVLLAIYLLLTACSSDKEHHPVQSIKVGKEEKVDSISTRKLKNIAFEKAEYEVLLLLPMSGVHSELGHGILNAIMLAVYESNNKKIDFYVIDTADTLNGKYKLYDKFKNRNLKAIIGPVFFNEAREFGALFPKIPIFALSNNLKLNNDHVFACGLSPKDEIKTLFSFARSHNIDSFLILLPNGSFGNQILNYIKNEMKLRKLKEAEDVKIIRYDHISKKNATKLAKASEKQVVFAMDPILDISKLDDKKIFTLSSSALADETTWRGAIFAFADNPSLSDFQKKYQIIFQKSPSIIDIVAYDVSKAILKAIYDSEYVNSKIPVEELDPSIPKKEENIFEKNYEGCLGNFSINKKRGLRRKLSTKSINL